MVEGTKSEGKEQKEMDPTDTNHKDYHPLVRQVRSSILITELQRAAEKNFTHVQYGGSHCSIDAAIGKIREEFDGDDIVQIIAKHTIIPAVHVYG